MSKRRITALYERLSRDDDQQSESNSITNQKMLLESYAAQHSFQNPVNFTDDGLSGTRIDRPVFMALMKEVEVGNTVYLFLKDMSRMGHDYSNKGQIRQAPDRDSHLRLSLKRDQRPADYEQRSRRGREAYLPDAH